MPGYERLADERGEGVTFVQRLVNTLKDINAERKAKKLAKLKKKQEEVLTRTDDIGRSIEGRVGRDPNQPMSSLDITFVGDDLRLLSFNAQTGMTYYINDDGDIFRSDTWSDNRAFILVEDEAEVHAALNL